MRRNHAELLGVPEMEEKQKNKRYVLRKLFFASLYLSTFTFGGGYVIVTLLKEKFVDQYHWIDEEEMLDLVAIAQSSPGAIAVNSATFVGTRIAGPGGAVVATLGCILPSCIIVTLLAYIYTKYRKMSLLQGTLTSLRPAVVAMIAKAGVTILVSSFFINGALELFRENICIRMVVFFTAALVLLRKFKMNPILVMVLCGVANMLFCAAAGS